MTEFLMWLRGFIESLAPALAVIIYNYDQEKISQAKSDAELSKLQLQEKNNNEQVDNKYSGKSDIDVLNDVIKRPKP